MSRFTEQVSLLEQGMGFYEIFVKGVPFQVCLKQNKAKNGYIKTISLSDCGYDDGICGDVNEKALSNFKEDYLFSVLRRNAKADGVRIIK